MNSDFEELYQIAKGRLKSFRELRDDMSAVIVDEGRSESIPAALFLDSSISAQAVRAWLILRSYGATPFPGNKTLGKILGGAGGATNATDELFIEGWLLKETVRDERGAPVGTIYILFSQKKLPSELVSILSWANLVRSLCDEYHRLETASAKEKAKKKHRSRLRTKALLIKEQIPDSEFRVRISGLGIPSESSSYIEVSSKKKPREAGTEGDPVTRDRLSFSDEFGLEWQPAWDRFLAESRVTAILKKHQVTDVDHVRRKTAEWASSCLRHSVKKEPFNPAALLIHLLKKETVIHTAEGDSRLPAFCIGEKKWNKN